MNLLAGYKVIELASVLAGPSVGQFLAELGADVIKVENPNTQGDVTRSWQAANEKVYNGISAYFASVNWGKKSVFWNLQKKEDLQQLYDLVKASHIVIASYKPGDAEKLKVSYKDLSTINPQIIYGHITGYGNHYDKVGYDAIIQAETGFMYMNGTPETPPIKMPVALMDVLAGHQLKQGILMAILQKERTGKGAYVEVSLFDSAVSALVNQASNWLNAKHIPERIGNEHPNIVPYGSTFKTKDNKLIILAVGTDKQFAQLCNILQITEIAQKPEFTTNAQRVKNARQLLAILQEKIALWEKETLLEALHQAKIPAGGINSLPETFALPFTRELLFENASYKGIRQWAGKIDGQRGKKLSFLPTLES